METAATGTRTFTYKRHEPEKTLLYQVILREWDTWFAERQADTSRSPLPAYVEREFEAFLRCGRPEFGFVMLACDGCGYHLPVAFSCKKKGFCASCGAKRQSETAVHLIDNLLPHVAFRQWVVMAGVFSVAGPTPVFFQLRGPTDEELADIVEAAANIVIETLRKDGYLTDEGVEIDRPDWVDKDFADTEQLSAAVAASGAMRIAFGDRAGQRVRRIGRGFGYEEELPMMKGKRCYSVKGFTIHANRYIGAQERSKLEQLLAYGARGSFANERLSLADPSDPTGDLVYTLKRVWSDGTEAIKMSAPELIEKLVSLIPPPYLHASRYFGVLASHSRWRHKIILRPGIKKGFVASQDSQTPQKMTWSRLLKRVFKIDVTQCQACGAKLNPETCEVVTDPQTVAAILAALGMNARPPQRGPPPRQLGLFDADVDIDQRQPEYDD